MIWFVSDKPNIKRKTPSAVQLVFFAAEKNNCQSGHMTDFGHGATNEFSYQLYGYFIDGN